MPTGHYERKPRVDYSKLIGEKRNSITCVGVAPRRKRQNGYFSVYIKVLCDCGNNFEVSVFNFGKTRICVKCRKGEKSCSYKHNGEKEHHRLYNIWLKMRTRCSERGQYHKKWYFDRGIRVCNEWDIDFVPFRDWALANGYKDNLSLDRINNDGNYEPANCRWATQEQQSCNTRRNVFIEYKGLRKTISQWVRITGGRTVEHRLYRKLPIEKVFKGYENKIDTYIAANPHELVE